MLWLIVAIIAWGVVHSFLASIMVKEWARRRLGEAGERYYRLAYNLVAGLSLLPILALAYLTPDQRLYQVGMPWVVVMVAGQFLAVIVLLVGFRQKAGPEILGMRQAMGMPEEGQGKLVTSGLYSQVRHPIYTASLALAWLMPVMTVNLLTMLVAFTIYVVVGAVFEERKLVREYGQAFKDYAAVTPMLIPWVKRNKGQSKTSM